MSQQANQVPKSDDCREALSRLIDGELDAGGCRALLDRLERDPDARGSWVLLNVACDAVRSSETASLHSTTFVARVSAALDAEPVILAPGAARRRLVMVRRVAVPAAAVAAAMVVLVVVAVPQLRGSTGTAPSQMARETPVAPADASNDVARSKALDAYLEAHRETTRAAEFILPATATTEAR